MFYSCCLYDQKLESFSACLSLGEAGAVCQRFTCLSPGQGSDTPSSVYGKQDAFYFRDQFIEMCSGLSELNKPVQLVAYDGRDDGTVFSHPDLWPRVISWFDKFLDVTRDQDGNFVWDGKLVKSRISDSANR